MKRTRHISDPTLHMTLKKYLDNYTKPGDIVKIVQGFDPACDPSGLIHKNAEIWTIPSYNAVALKMALNSAYGMLCDPSLIYLAQLLKRQVAEAYIHEEIGMYSEAINTTHEVYMVTLAKE